MGELNGAAPNIGWTMWVNAPSGSAPPHDATSASGFQFAACANSSNQIGPDVRAARIIPPRSGSAKTNAGRSPGLRISYWPACTQASALGLAGNSGSMRPSVRRCKTIRLPLVEVWTYTRMERPRNSGLGESIHMCTGRSSDGGDAAGVCACRSNATRGRIMVPSLRAEVDQPDPAGAREREPQPRPRRIDRHVSHGRARRGDRDRGHRLRLRVERHDLIVVTLVVPNPPIGRDGDAIGAAAGAPR